jgi:hypothetical protein
MLFKDEKKWPIRFLDGHFSLSLLFNFMYFIFDSDVVDVYSFITPRLIIL